MAKIIFGNEARLADRIIRSLPRQVEIAARLGKSKQAINYRINEVYPEMLEEALKLIDMAGYEVKEKEQ